MGYSLEGVTMRDNMKEDGMQRISAVWADIISGRIPLVVDSDGNPREGISPITKYHSWDPDDPSAECEFTIMVVPTSFFEEMAQNPAYAVFEGSGADIGEAGPAAWGKMERAVKAGEIAPLYADDYESTVPPQYAKDGKWHCYLYAHIEPREG